MTALIVSITCIVGIVLSWWNIKRYHKKLLSKKYRMFIDITQIYKSGVSRTLLSITGLFDSFEAALNNTKEHLQKFNMHVVKTDEETIINYSSNQILTHLDNTPNVNPKLEYVNRTIYTDRPHASALIIEGRVLER